MEKFFDNLVNMCTKAGIKLIVFILILVIGFKAIKWITKVIQNGKLSNKLDKSVETFLLSGISLILKIVLIMTSLNYIGVPMTSMIALISTFGLALGLALQGGLSNIAGGLMILIFKPFKVGDYIDTHTDSGTVVDINIFYTVLLTPDNKEISLPNGSLSNSNIINYSAKKKRRIDLKYTVSYECDIDKVKKVINKVLDNEALILKDEDTFVRLGEHADSALVFYVRVWALSKDYWDVYFNLNENIKREFDKNNIEIPYPQIDVHIKK
ncbi:small-conductance mechanosensitive channel [Clostridium sp. CAG:1193]|nr:small-conductance mechanosensitive channel [Clostridium sp. CAG:1193]